MSDSDAIEITVRAWPKICDRPCPVCGAMCANNGSEGPRSVRAGDVMLTRCAHCPAWSCDFVLCATTPDGPRPMLPCACDGDGEHRTVEGAFRGNAAWMQPGR